MKKYSKNTIKRRLSTERPRSKSALNVKKQRVNLKRDLIKDGPLSEKETHRLNRKLRDIESATLYEKGLNHISGGFSKTIVGESDRDTIDVTLVYGVEGTSSEEEKIVINRKTMDRVRKNEEGRAMKVGGKVGGSVWGHFKKGERITDFSNVNEGDILLEHSSQFNADNVVEVTKIRKEYPNDKGTIRIINGRFVDPNNTSKLRRGAEPDGFSIWDYDLKREDFYFPKEYRKTKEEGGYMAEGGEVAKRGIGDIPNNYQSNIYSDSRRSIDDIWNHWDKSQKHHFLLDHTGIRKESDLQKAMKIEKFELDNFETTEEWQKEMNRKINDEWSVGDIRNYLLTHIQEGQYSSGGSISPEKARKILHDGEVHGKPLTEDQRKFFGARASGYPVKRKEEGGYADGGQVSSVIDPKKINNDVFYIGEPIEKKYVNADKSYWEQKVGGESADGGKAISHDTANTKEDLDIYAKKYGIKRVTEQEWKSMKPPFNENISKKEGGYVKDSGKYQINVHGDKPEDYKIVCTITRSGGKEVQVCYSERNDKKKKAVEIYSGKNYIHGSKDPSFSKKYDLEEVPVKYKEVIRELKKEHHNRFEGGGSMASGGKVSSSDLLDTIKKRGNKITEQEINLIKLRENNDKKYEGQKELVQYIWDNTPELTEEQNKKGLDYLMNKWKSPSGKERSNNPYGYREQEVLEKFKNFELAGFYDISRYGGRKFYVPLYNAIGEDGSFQYYVNMGEVNIVG